MRPRSLPRGGPGRADENLFYLPSANRWPMRARLVTAIVIAASALLCFGAPSSGAGDAVQADISWTLMIYMANDVSTPLPWEENINSMEAAAQAEGVSIIALVDNPGDGDSVIYKIEHDLSATLTDTVVSTKIDDGGAVIPVTGEATMADPSTLTSFIVFSATEFPADRLVLVLWGHGSGWHGLCLDKTDLLTLPELSAALAGAAAGLGRTVDMVVVDACAGATMEMLAELASRVPYFVGAQNNVPSQGLPYREMIESLSASKGQSLEEFAATIVSQYIENAWYVSPYSATMAAFDLGKIGAAFSLLDELSVEGVKYGSIFHAVINEALVSAEYYSTEWYVDLVDLLNIIHESELPLELRTLAVQTAVSFREAVVAFEKYDHPDPFDGVSVGRANGAVIYAPTTSYYEAPYYSLTISNATHWDEFGTLARLVMPSEPMARGPSVSNLDADQDGLQDTIFLEWDDDYPHVEAWVFNRLPNGIVLRDRIIATGSNITIHGHMGNLVIAASALDSDDTAVSYTTLNAALYGQIKLDFLLTRDGQPVGEGFDVQVVSSAYTGYAMPQGDAQTVTLTIPTHAHIGEMIVVRIMEGDELVLTSRLVIGEHNATLTIEVHEQDEGAGAQDAVILALSLLPGLIIGIFAAVLYLDYRRANRDY